MEFHNKYSTMQKNTYLKNKNKMLKTTAKQLAMRAGLVAITCAAADVAAEPRAIEEVIVTSQKTAQSLQDVPISVSAVTGDILREANINTLAELATQLPNVSFATEGQRSEQVYIRGFGTNPFNPSFESSVAMVVDEVYYGRAAYFSEVPFDIERIEVLRGPQGTLFGKNTVAGVFNMSSRDVGEEFQFYGEFGGGDFGGQKYEIGAGGMLNDWFGLRVSAIDVRTDGQLYNQFLDNDQENPIFNSQRLKFRIAPSDSLDIELIAMRSETELEHWALQLMEMDDDTREYMQQFDPDIEDDPFDYTTSMNADGYVEKETNTYSATLEWALGEVLGLADLNMTVVAAQTEMLLNMVADLDVSPADIATIHNGDDYMQQTLEWRFAGSADSLFGLGTGVDFVVGAYYFYSDYAFDGGFRQGEDTAGFILTQDAADLAGDQAALLPALYLLTVSQSNQRYDFDFDRSTESASIFGQATWYITEELSITPGIRINHEIKKADVIGTMSCDNVVPVVGDMAPCSFGFILNANSYTYVDKSKSETDISPKLSIAYSPHEDINFYMTFSQGFKSGGYNALSFTGEQLEYDSELARTIEFGSKGRFFDNTLSVNAAIFQTKFEDLQVLAYNGVFFDVRNAASATARGIELDWKWLSPWEWFSFSGAIGYLDSTYDDYPGAPTPIYDGQDGERNLKGERVAYSPESSVTLSPMVQFPISANHGVQTVLDVIYTGDKFTDTDLDRNSYVAENTKYNLRVSLGHIERYWSLSVGVKNLTDEEVLNIVTDAPFYPGTYYAHQANGREAFAALRFDW